MKTKSFPLSLSIYKICFISISRLETLFNMKIISCYAKRNLVDQSLF